MREDSTIWGWTQGYRKSWVPGRIIGRDSPCHSAKRVDLRGALNAEAF
jgi:hypothetical protein